MLFMRGKLNYLKTAFSVAHNASAFNRISEPANSEPANSAPENSAPANFSAEPAKFAPSEPAKFAPSYIDEPSLFNHQIEPSEIAGQLSLAAATVEAKFANLKTKQAYATA